MFSKVQSKIIFIIKILKEHESLTFSYKIYLPFYLLIEILFNNVHNNVLCTVLFDLGMKYIENYELLYIINFSVKIVS